MISLLDQLLLFRFTLFSLPWLVVSYFALSASYPIENKGILFWICILISFVGARSLGMGLNRIIDWKIDRQNPRTINRPLVNGTLSMTVAYAIVLGAFLLLVLPFFYLGRDLFLFALLPILLITTYSWTKRWTPFCHFFLGSIYLFLPTALSVALFGRVYPEALWLGGAIAAFITAGDLLYAIQDIEVDKKAGLKSFPAVFGVEQTVWNARVLVVFAVCCLFALHFTVSAIVLALLWNRYLFSSEIYDGAFANEAFKTCNLCGGFLLLLTFWIS